MPSIWDDIEKQTFGDAGKPAPTPKENPTSVWDSIEAKAFGTEPKYKRGLFDVANDTVITTANAALGGVKAVSDFVSPGNRFSKGVQSLIDEGNENKSVVAKASDAQLEEAMNRDSAWGQVKGVLGYVKDNPLQAAAQAAGSFAGPGVAVKGARGVAGALNFGEKAVTRAGLGASVATSAAMGGGDAAGQAYDDVYAGLKAQGYSDKDADKAATDAARKASIAPALIGGATGFFGAEGALARGGTKSILKTAGEEFASEAFEEGATQLSANVATKQYLPETDIWKGVAGASALGGVLGGGTGLAVGVMTKHGDNTFLPNTNQANDLSGGIRQAINVHDASSLSTQQIINQNLGIIEQTKKQLEAAHNQRQADLTAAFNEKTGQFVTDPKTGLERELTAGEVSALQAGVANDQAQQLANQNAQANQQQAAAQQQQASAEQLAAREDVLKKYGGAQPIPNVPNGFSFLGKNYFTPTELAKAVDKIVEEEKQKPGHLRQAEQAIIDAHKNNFSGKGPLTPNNLKGGQFGRYVIGTNSIDEVIARIDADIKQINQKKGKADQARLGFLQNIRDNLTGENNGQVPVQQQTASGVGTVSKQSSANATATGNNGAVQSKQVQSVGARSQSVGSTTEQALLTGENGTRSGTTNSSTTSNSSTDTKTQTQVSKEQEEWEAMDGTNTPYASLPKEIQSAWSKAVKTGKATGQVQDELAALAKRESDRVAAGSIVSEVLKRAVKRAGKRSEADHKLFLDYIERAFGGSRQNEAEEKNQMDLKGNERRVGGWNREIRELPVKKGKELLAAAEAVAKERGMSAGDVLKLVTENLTKSEEIHNETNKTAVDQRDLMKNEDGTSKGMGKSQQTYKEAKAKKEKKEKEAKNVPEVTTLDPEEYMKSEEYKLRQAEAEKKSKVSNDDAAQEKKERQMWDNHAKQFNLPMYDDLPPGAKADWMASVQNGKTNLAAANRVLEQNGLNDEAQFSKAKGKVKDAWTADFLKDTLKSLFNANRNFDALVTVVDKFSELPTHVQNALKNEKYADKAQAFVYGKRVYMIASNIAMGQELGVALHEIGAHLGMENLIGPQNYHKLYKQLENWANGDGTTTESKIAKKAKERVEAAKTKDEHYQDEMIAYFIEEAVAAGIQPLAIAKEQSVIGKWFRDLVAGLKAGLRKIGFGKFENLTAGNIVDLAFGAAKLEISGTFHGSAAEFKKFMTAHIGTGEGATAFGWGLYMAERFGTARDYMNADVKRKSEYSGYSYKGESAKELRRKELKNHDIENYVALSVIRQAKKQDAAFGVKAPIADYIKYEIDQWQKRIDNKEVGTISGMNQRFIDALKKLDPKDFTTEQEKLGHLYRTLPMVSEDQLLDLDTRLSKQPEILATLEEKLPQDVKDDLLEYANQDLNEMTGRELQDKLAQLNDKGINDSLFYALPDKVIETIKPGQFMSKQIVSEFLRTLGIEGNTYLDRGSRGAISSEEQLRNVVLFSDEAINRIATYENAKRDNVKFSFAAVEKAKGMAEKNISEMPKVLQGPIRGVINALFNAKETLLSVMITEDVATMAKKMINNPKWQQAIDKYIATQHERNFIVNTHEEALAKVLVNFNKLNQHTKTAVNKIIEDSTISEKWAYDPKIPNVKVNVDKDLEARLKALPKEAQDVVKFVFDYGRVTLKEKQDTIRAIVDESFKDNPDDPKKAELLKSFGTILRMNPTSPYAPLKRFGSFVVVGKSQAYLEAEKNKDNKELEKLRSQGNHYIVSFVDTAGQARQLWQDLKSTGNYDKLDAFKKSEIKDKLFSGTDLWKGFEKLKRVIAAEKGIEGNEIATQLEKMVNELYLISLADTSARKSELQRKKIFGYDGDMMRSFFVQGMADAHYIANMKTSRKSLDAMVEMQKQAGEDPEKANPYLNELMAREAQSLESRPASWLDMANRMTAHWFLTFSPAFYLQQMTQTYTLSLPWLAGEYNYFKSERALRAAYKEVLPLVSNTNLKEHLDFSKLPADVRDMLQILVGRGRINIGIEAEIGNHRSTTSSAAAQAYESATDFLRGGINRIEAINRATAAIAAYRLEMAKSGNKERAIAAADKVVHVTHGSYDGFNTPRLFNKGPVMRSVTQFRRFQIIQLSMLTRMGYNWAKGANATEKAIAKKQFLFLMGHMFGLAGAKGLPMWGLASLIYGLARAAFGDDDDPEDLEEVLRQSGGIMLAKGIPAWLGVDLSDKLGMGKVTSILPYTDIDLTSKGGVEKTLAGLMGPFIGGMTTKAGDAIGMLAQGEYYKGLETMLPNGFNNIAKSIRFASEGITQRNGDLVMSPEELGFFDIISQGLGLPSTTITERQYLQNQVKKYDDFYDNRATEIKRDYVRAFRANDTAALSDARDAWATLQESRSQHGYRRQPMSELMRAPMQAKKREQGVIGGVETTNNNRGFVRKQLGE